MRGRLKSNRTRANSTPLWEIKTVPEAEQGAPDALVNYRERDESHGAHVELSDSLRPHPWGRSSGNGVLVRPD